MTEIFILHLMILILTTEYSDVTASPLSSNTGMLYPLGRLQMSKTFPITQTSNGVKEQPSRQLTRVRTVTVFCHENYMEIAIKADLFDTGLPVDASELLLGPDSQLISSCKVTAFSANEYIIEAALTDCGTQHWITDDSLIYTNLLIFTPQPSPDGVVRLEQAVVPIECYYSRRFDVTSNPIRPTWIPYGSTQSSVEGLQFSLKLMTSDWRIERASAVFFLGDIINLEASVHLGHHVDLRVYFESCIATVTQDISSVPSYTFIENYGCLMDGRITASKSRFLPRIQNDRLQLQLDTFKFHKEARPEIYITCTLQAYPVTDPVSPVHKACYFANGSWKSADGGDWVCYSCQGPKEAPSTLQQSVSSSATRLDQSQRPNKSPPKIHNGSESSFTYSLTESEFIPSWRNIILPPQEDEGIGSMGWEKEQTVGPLAIFSKKSKMGILAPPRVKEGLPPLPSLKPKKPMPHSSLRKNGVPAGKDQEGDAATPPTLEPTEQLHIADSELPSEKTEDDEYDHEDGDYKEDYDGEDGDHDYEDKKKGTDQDTWKTRVLPEEDFNKLFKTHDSKNENVSELHTFGASPSLPDEEEPADMLHPSKGDASEILNEGL